MYLFSVRSRIAYIAKKRRNNYHRTIEGSYKKKIEIKRMEKKNHIKVRI